VIQTKMPARPSTRLSAMAMDELTTVSRQRRSDPPKLTRQLRGDLDCIVMKAMEKDRALRYSTANAFATEVRRYLAGELVQVRPPSQLYVARKLIARNKLLSSGIALIFVLLAGGLAVTTRLFLVEREARERSEHQEEVFRLEGLGIMYWQRDNASEAERCFRQSFAIRRQFLQGQPPNVIVAADFVRLLQQENKFGEGDGLFTEFPREKLLAVPGYAGLFRGLGENLAKEGRWREAVKNVADLVAAEPDSPNGYHMLAPLLAACGDISGYQQLCQQIIRRFSNAFDPSVADQMAKDCLILPSSGADLNAVGALADVAVTRGTNYLSYPLFKCCKALAEYRLGRPQEAIKWADSATKDDFPYSKAEGYAVLAMAQFKSGQTNPAIATLVDCARVVDTRLPNLSGGNLGQDWRDWIIAHALFSEATNLICAKH
jgi:tetratricopeptide (TPR) repeat protein